MKHSRRQHYSFSCARLKVAWVPFHFIFPLNQLIVFTVHSVLLCRRYKGILPACCLPLCSRAQRHRLWDGMFLMWRPLWIWKKGVVGFVVRCSFQLQAQLLFLEQLEPLLGRFAIYSKCAGSFLGTDITASASVRENISAIRSVATLRLMRDVPLKLLSVAGNSNFHEILPMYFVLLRDIFITLFDIEKALQYMH